MIMTQNLKEYLTIRRDLLLTQVEKEGVEEDEFIDRQLDKLNDLWDKLTKDEQSYVLNL